MTLIIAWILIEAHDLGFWWALAAAGVWVGRVLNARYLAKTRASSSSSGWSDW